MKDNSDKEFKAIDNAFTKEVRSDLEHNVDKFRDPVIQGEMMYRLLEERENTNRLMKTLLQKLESIEAKLVTAADSGNMPDRKMQNEIHQIRRTAISEPLLPEVDEHIMESIRHLGKVTAEEIRVKFNYRGKNAASARLNRLFELGLLQKQQVGKKVFFFPISR